MQVLNQFLERISTTYLGGIPVDRVATVLAVLLSYALAHLFRLIPAKQTQSRHLFSIVATLFLFGIVQEQFAGLVHLFAGALGLYAVIRALQNNPRMPVVVFVLAMAHMSYSQIRRQLYETGGTTDLDYTGAQMVFVIKVTSLAFCIRDGREKVERLSAYQKKNAIQGVPGLLEYIGYVFFFPGFAVGPAFEMATYRQMVVFDGMSTERKKLNRRAYGTLLVGMLCLAVFVKYSAEYNYINMALPAFSHLGIIGRTLRLFVSGIVTRAAYYTAWKMSEGACILTGLGFDGYAAKTGEALWMDISNVHILDVELGTSMKQLVDGWNIGTNTWLRHHVYLRITKPGGGSSTMATLLTFLVSALWHGFYPGYYLTFVLAALAASAARTLRRNLHRPVLRYSTVHGLYIKKLYDFAGWALSKYTLDFVATPFMALTLPLSLDIWRYNYFLLPLGIAFVHVAFNVLGAGRFLSA
ncbi:Lysophospholipid acyltransferase [Kickxella alabastrina]|uniref:Lysophospholipid acyltransferase n=1 Tax=Kickxella alabastrina TaxID=61397 RepID=A0ACC1IEB9_9FUNG|nr:Lysophospholipid acyltransferase [Kickxella alabastrina]